MPGSPPPPDLPGRDGPTRVEGAAITTIRAGDVDAGSPVSTQRVLDAVRGVGVAAYLQPIVDLARGAVAGHECLARFGDGPGPLVWLHAAREAGLGCELELAALRAALDRRADVPRNTFLTVNLSPDLLQHRPIRQLFEQQGSLAGLVLELTEDVRIESYDAVLGPLRELRQAGAAVAVDDAGAGYAGLQHLLHLRPDFVKLDRDIVAGLDGDEAKRAMVEMMGTLAGRLDAWVVAEGVETPAELAVLVDLGVPLAQGYHLGRPQPGFAQVDDDVARRILERAPAPDDDACLAPLVEPGLTAPTRDEARSRLDPRGRDPVTVVDSAGRPVGTVRADGLWCPVRAGALRLGRSTPVVDAAARALLRPAQSRFDPLLCTDDEGRFLGVVRMERVLDALARAGQT